MRNSVQSILIGTFIGPSKPFKLPRRNRIVTAIQKLMLRPNRVLKMILKSNNHIITTVMEKGTIA